MPIDYSKYPPNWFTELRPAVLARANDCCEECGVINYAIIQRSKNGSWRYTSFQERDMIYSKVKYSGYTKSGAIKSLGYTKVILTIAHLDHDNQNHLIDLSRLKALCQRCHLRYDQQHHAENRRNGRNWKQNQTRLDL